MTIDPTAQKFLNALAKAGGPPIYTMSPSAARAVLSGAQAAPVAKLPAEIRNVTIPAGPTGSTRLRVVRPQGKTERLPVVMYFHGGGWILGDADTHDRLVREIAVGAQAAVVFVDYERSPEAQYPVAIEQGYAATAYVAAHPAEFNIDPARLAIAGDSAGGDLAAVICLLAKERNGPKIALQVLLYPVTDANLETGSYNQFAEGPWLTKAAMKWFWDAYLPDEAKRKDPHASPLRASLDQLRGLPPALVIVDENDVLRDEGEAYARKLSEAGLPVVSTRYNGLIHDFAMLNALAEAPGVRAAIRQTNDALRAALHK